MDSPLLKHPTLQIFETFKLRTMFSDNSLLRLLLQLSFQTNVIVLITHLPDIAQRARRVCKNLPVCFRLKNETRYTYIYLFT